MHSSTSRQNLVLLINVLCMCVAALSPCWLAETHSAIGTGKARCVYSVSGADLLRCSRVLHEGLCRGTGQQCEGVGAWVRQQHILSFG